MPRMCELISCISLNISIKKLRGERGDKVKADITFKPGGEFESINISDVNNIPEMIEEAIRQLESEKNMLVRQLKYKYGKNEQ